MDGLGREEFNTLGHLSSAAALEALTPRLEPLLMALNDRPFAGKVVEARNRAAQPGIALFRRNSFYAGPAGHLYAFHYVCRWEPQINLGLYAAPQWGQNAVRAGIGFNLRGSEADPEQEARNVLDQFKLVLAQVGMTMDDLVTVQVFCPDIALFDKWNGVYRSYFGKDFPARAFIGSGPLLFNAHFEMQGVAVKEGAGKAALKSGKKKTSAAKKTAGNSKQGM